jgi:hypothetical protein
VHNRPGRLPGRSAHRRASHQGVCATAARAGGATGNSKTNQNTFRVEEGDMSDVLPPIPAGLSMPFYYATLQTHWVYFRVAEDLAHQALAGTACEPYVFADHKAVAVINFQRYLSTGNAFLGTTNEVEFNLIAFPRSARARVASSMTLAQYAYGEDLQKVIGHFRLHVPADSGMAVWAGRELFGEPKFASAFDTAVPSLNNPPPNSPIRHELGKPFPAVQSPTHWRYTVSTTVPAVGADGKPEYRPGRIVSPDGKTVYKADQAIYTLEIDVAGLDPIMANASEIVEYGHLGLSTGWPLNDQGFAWTERHPKAAGELIGGRWSLYGTYATYFPSKDMTYEIEYGSAKDSPMQIDMRRLIGSRRPVLFQVFESPPAAAESRAFYVDPR